MHTSLINSAVRDTYPAYMYNAVVSAPAADVALVAGEVVIVSGTPAITVVFA